MQLCQRRVRDEEEAHAAREVPRRDGAPRAVVAADLGDRAAVPDLLLSAVPMFR